MPFLIDTSNEHLTIMDAKLETLRRRTYPGMAHFAGSGPEGLTCRQCVHWRDISRSHDYFAAGGKHRGRIKPHTCLKYRDLMQGLGPAIPDEAPACKYFEQSENVPERFYK